MIKSNVRDEKQNYGNEDHIEYSSSESDREEDRIAQMRKQIQKPLQKIEKQIDEDSLSEDDSSSDDNFYHKRKIQMYGKNRGEKSEEEEQEEEFDKSIDQIEERIKKLERDLQDRIGKHKGKKAVNKEKAASGLISPPLPKRPDNVPKKVEHKDANDKCRDLRSGYSSKQNFRGKEQSVKILTPKRMKQKKQIHQSLFPTRTGSDKQRVDSSKNLRNDQAIGYHAQQLSKANKQIEQQQKALEDLRNENKKLREQINASKKKKTLNGQVQKLKEMTVRDGAFVHIDLSRKIIEGLHAKLKHSIHKKLTKTKGATYSASLMHKGLPSSLV